MYNKVTYLVALISNELNELHPNNLGSVFIFIIDGLIQIVSGGSCNTEEKRL
jgi:hypothetical protein